jgi:hypothetical protein
MFHPIGERKEGFHPFGAVFQQFANHLIALYNEFIILLPELLLAK